MMSLIPYRGKPYPLLVVKIKGTFHLPRMKKNYAGKKDVLAGLKGINNFESIKLKFFFLFNIGRRSFKPS